MTNMQNMGSSSTEKAEVSRVEDASHSLADDGLRDHPKVTFHFRQDLSRFFTDTHLDMESDSKSDGPCESLLHGIQRQPLRGKISHVHSHYIRTDPSI